MRESMRRVGAMGAFVICGLILGVFPAWADVRLPHVLGSNMVLQRDAPIRFWGWAAPGEKVTVACAGTEADATADARGEWQLSLPPLAAGGPHTVTVRGTNTIELTNVLVGEVWVCSGQSNMEMGIGVCFDAQEEIAKADRPEIRLFDVPKVPAGEPADDVDTTWQVCSPATVAAGGWGGFSAVAYYFGCELHKELGIPVGIIDTSWGGTIIEPWTPPEGFAAVPAVKNFLDVIANADAEYRKAQAAATDAIAEWVPVSRQAIAAGGHVPPPPAWPGHPLNSHAQATGLYNGMVHPLVPFAIRGAIWYQGESNRADGMLYHEKMKALIAGWRSVWKQGDFPFYYVQLAPFIYGSEDPAILARCWEAQTATLAVKNTGMAVTVDISEIRDIHPRNKRDVGKRLALWALAKDYGKTDLVYSGPLYKSMAVEEGKVRLAFDYTGSGLVSRDGKDLSWFEIAGADKVFVPATATIDGANVLVGSEKVAAPVAVRFGWSQQAEPNLSNKEGLPASPFRTDQW
ncbi:MAG: sialate O-acetylesterase [Pirellulaceae bacterium]